jgi:hypothetical protein
VPHPHQNFIKAAHPLTSVRNSIFQHDRAAHLPPP